MNDTENQSLSVLLPSAEVAVFTRDSSTVEAAEHASQDWRFARVTIEISEGGVEEATQTYKSYQSPDLVIVQTDTIDEDFIGQLEVLASHCGENTEAVVIGPLNDVYLYRKLIEMGVSDYLVRPIEPQIFAEVIAKTLTARMGVTESHLLAFIGAKGGVGTSILSESVAWCSADFLSQKTMLLDMAGGWSSLAVGMGFEPSTTLAEASRAAENGDEDSLERMLFKASEKLHVLASGSDSMLDPSISGEQCEALLNMLMIKYPVVIADLSESPSELQRAVINRAHEIVIVATPVLSSLRLARTLIHEIKEIRGGENQKIDLLLNMEGMASAQEMSKNDIEQVMNLRVSSVVPFLPKVFLAAESESMRLTNMKEAQEVLEQSIFPLTCRLIGIDDNPSGQPGKNEGLLGFLKRGQ